MQQPRFIGSIFLTSILLLLLACGDSEKSDQPAAVLDADALRAAGITVERGLAVGGGIGLPGSGTGGDSQDGGPSEAIPGGLTVTGHGHASAEATGVIAEFAVESYPKNYGPGLACGNCTGPATPPTITEDDAITKENLAVAIDRLVAAGVSPDDITIDPQTLSFNVLHATLRVRVRDFAILDTAVQAINSTIPPLSDAIVPGVVPLVEITAWVRSANFTFVRDDCQEMERAALEAALDDARVQAEYLADVAGRTIGDLVGLQDQASRYYYSGDSSQDCGVPAGTEYYDGLSSAIDTTVTVNASISATYEMN